MGSYGGNRIWHKVIIAEARFRVLGVSLYYSHYSDILCMLEIFHNKKLGQKLK